MAGKGKGSSPGGSLLELMLIVAVALGLALGIQALLVKPYRIPSPSMVPTLEVGQRVLVNRIGERFSDPEVGDVVVFHPPTGAEDLEDAKCGQPVGRDEICDRPTSRAAEVNFIKRVVAGPGDELGIEQGHVILNGKRRREPFARECEGDAGCTFSDTITVPAGHYFMMGDNRGASDDSRFWGPVPRDWIIGGAIGTYWPPKRVGLL